MKNLNFYICISMIWLALTLTIAVTSTSSSFAFEWNVAQFNQATNLRASPESIRQVWHQLVLLETTDYLGGRFDRVSLTPSTMIAGAIAFGSIEFDNLIRLGEIPSAYESSISQLLNTMKSAETIDLTSVLNASSQNPEFDLAPIPARTAPIVERTEIISSDACSPYVQTSLTEQGQQYVAEITNASISDETGFSTIKSNNGEINTGGFASLGCLEKLFLNFNVTTFFNPPGFSSMISRLENWDCMDALDVISQITQGQSEVIFNNFLSPFNLKTANSSDNQNSDQTGAFHFLTNEQRQNSASNASLKSLF